MKSIQRAMMLRNMFPRMVAGFDLVMDSAPQSYLRAGPSRPLFLKALAAPTETLCRPGQSLALTFSGGLQEDDSHKRQGSRKGQKAERGSSRIRRIQGGWAVMVGLLLFPCHPPSF